MKTYWFAVSFLLALSSVADAAPGLDEEVYGATIEPGKSEIETRYARLLGEPAKAEEALVLEGAHGFSSRLYGAALAAFAAEPGTSRRLESLAVEGIFALGAVKSLDLDAAVYVEAEHDLHGADKLETKLLLQRRNGRSDIRLNLIAERAERAAARGKPIDFSYAASADYRIMEDVSLGAEAFGDLGTSEAITVRTEHFVGPSAKAEFDHVGPGELELRTGYLFPVGRAPRGTKGQLRFGVDYEF